MFDPEIAARVCDLIAGGKSLRAACEEIGGPKPPTICLWLSQRPDFAEQYARARDMQCDYFADEAVEEARLATNENAAAVRVRLDAIKWFAGKVAPKKYGDRAAVELTGKDGAPLQPESNPTEIARRVAFMLRKGAEASEEPQD